MKRFMSAALVATLFAGTAMAQPQDGGDRGQRGGEQRQGGGGGGQRQDRGQGPQQAQPAPQAQQAPQAPQSGGPQPGRGSYLRTPGPQGDAARRGDDPRNVAPSRPDNAQRAPDNRGNGNRGPENRQGFDNRGNDNRGQNNRPGFDNRGPGPQVNRGPNPQQFRDRDRGRPQFDSRSFRPSYRAPQRFRAAPYRTPPGFFNRNWSYGDRLPSGWFGSGYYLNWGSYGLPLPPIGCEWVRVGSDALLVDIWSGQVLSVYYGLFW